MEQNSKLIRKMFIKIFPVQLLLLFIFNINTIIDIYMASHYLATKELASLALYRPFNNIMCLCYVFITGTQILVSKYMGRGKKDKAIAIFSTCCVIEFVFAIIVALLMLFIPTQIAYMLGANSECVAPLSEYLRATSFGALGLAFYGLFTSFHSMNDKVYLSSICVAVMIVVNVGLDLLLILVFNMGIKGLGLATSISNVTSAIVGGVCYFSKKSTIHISLKQLSLKKIPKIIKLGSNQIFFNLAIALSAVIINKLLIVYLDTDGAAVMAILGTMACFIGAIPASASFATLSIGGMYYGEGNKEKLVMLMKTVFKISVIIVAAVVLIFELGANYIAMIFKNPNADPSVLNIYNMTVTMLRLYVLELFPALVTSILVAMNQIQGKMVYVCAMLTLEQLFSALACVGLFFLTGKNVNGVWIGYFAGGLLLNITILITAFVKAKKVSFKAGVIARFDKSFGIDENDIFNYTIRNMNDVIFASKEMVAFCKERNISDKKAYYAALAIEEMGGNIVEHGFKKESNQQIDLTISRKDEDTIYVKIIDDGKAFDPVTYIKQFDMDDMTSNFGIKMIEKLSQDMRYQALFGLNTLTIKV